MGKLKLGLEAGLLVRGTMIRSLKRYCFMHDLEIQIDEDKGLLDSAYRITITGDDNVVRQAKRDLGSWIKKIEELNEED